MSATEEHLRGQAEACEALGSPLYAVLMRACAVDLAAGGGVADVLRHRADAPRDDLLGLRLLGGVHHLVLTGRAPRLARQYPSAGGTPDADLVPAFLDVVTTHGPGLRPWLDRPPQTNEVGRSAALVGGLLTVLAGRDLPVRLHEVGASAGLNLHADRYRYGTGGSWWGPAGSPVVLPDAWRGAAPDPAAPLRVVSRHGSDIAPVDLREPGAPDRLLAYVWPDQTARLARLRAALQVATADLVPVERLGAAAAVAGVRLEPDHLTVVWHSVMWQYLPAAEQQGVLDALDDLGAAADGRSPLLRLSLEPGADPSARDFVVSATTWPGGTTRVLAHASPHGVPSTWLA